MKEYQPVSSGKVREIYDVGDQLIMVASDRISAFDVILNNRITGKGKILTGMSRFWFDYTKDILPKLMRRFMTLLTECLPVMWTRTATLLVKTASRAYLR